MNASHKRLASVLDHIGVLIDLIGSDSSLDCVGSLRSRVLDHLASVTKCILYVIDWIELLPGSINEICNSPKYQDSLRLREYVKACACYLSLWGSCYEIRSFSRVDPSVYALFRILTGVIPNPRKFARDISPPIATAVSMLSPHDIFFTS